MIFLRKIPGYQVIVEAFRLYPTRSLMIVVCILFAGLAEGFGVAVFLPVLSLAVDQVGTQNTEIGKIVEEYLTRIGISTEFHILLILMVIGFSLKAALMMLAMQQIGFTSSYISTNLRFELIQAVLNAQWSYYSRQPIGILTNAVTTEANRGGATFTGAYTIVAITIQVAVYVIIAMLVSWELALASLIVGILIMFLLGSFISMSRNAAQKNSEAFDRIQRLLTDVLNGIKPLKAMSVEDRVGPLLREEAISINKSVRGLIVAKHGMQWLREPILVVFMALGLYGAVILWGFTFEVVLIMTLLFYRTSTSISLIQIAYQQLVSSHVYYQRVKNKINLANKNTEKFSGTIAPTFDSELKLENVSISLGNKLVLSNLSISIPSGKITTLFGPSGSGKTTLADLLIGLYKPDKGEVLVDNINLNEIDIALWRNLIGYVPQEMFLFHDTLLNNVTLGNPKISEKDAEHALKAADAWDFVNRLEQGIKSIVGEKGSMISGGERQRIAIARAIVRKPKLLILDEPTTALDPKTETEICLTLKKLSLETTVLVISHQKALLDIADISYRINNNRAFKEES